MNERLEELMKELKEKKSVLAFFIEVTISQSSPPFIKIEGKFTN